MMVMRTASKPQKYLIAAHAGAVVLIAAVAAFALNVPDFFKGLPMGMLLGIVVILFRRQMRDEYVEGLWNAGTAAAFLTALVSTMGVELVRGLTSDAIDAFKGPSLLDAFQIGSLTLAAFFIAFHVEMWRKSA